jgi:hypothetical protein
MMAASVLVGFADTASIHGDGDNPCRDLPAWL